MPIRFIHSRSRRIPSLVTLPFIQCHQTRGLAESGGVRNSRLSTSAGASVAIDTLENQLSAVSRKARAGRVSSIIARNSSHWGAQEPLVAVSPANIGRCAAESRLQASGLGCRDTH